MAETLPEGYSLKQNGLLIFVQKNGVTLRYAPRGNLRRGLPIGFRDRAKALEYAWIHSAFTELKK